MPSAKSTGIQSARLRALRLDQRGESASAHVPCSPAGIGLRRRLRPSVVSGRLAACPPLPGGHALRALADRLPAHRRRAHRALQLALRPPHRRHVPAAHRGHRPRPLDPRGDRRRSSRACAGSASTGTARRSASSPRAGRHAEVGRTRCSPAAPPTAAASTAEEIEAFRDAGPRRGPAAALPLALARRRPRDPPDAPFVVRLRAPREGETVVEDAVQGTSPGRTRRSTT